MRKLFLFILSFIIFFSCGNAETQQNMPGGNLNQLERPASWNVSVSKKDAKVGETIELIFTATIKDPWYLYSSDFDPNLGPTVTAFNFAPHGSYQLVGNLKAVNPKKKYEDIWGGEYTYFTGKGEFRQKIKLLKEDLLVKVELEGQVCNDQSGRCIQVEEDFLIDNKLVSIAATNGTNDTKPIPDTGKNVEPEPVKPQDTAEVPVTDTEQPEKVQKKLKDRQPDAGEISLLAFLIIAFGAGLVSLLTPCVFPMIPLTVTFFINASQSRGQAVKKALIYGFSIVFMFTVVGLLIARIGGPDVTNFLSTHWIPNVLFFLIFIVFGLSFLGLFEITLPSSFISKVDAQSDKGGVYGIFFMALTLVLVSFSCTVPIVGPLLIEASTGQALKPVLGMLSYSTAFAIPFTLFALFPSFLSRLPKSGGWMNVIKVTLGFLELGLAFKFLSIADRVYHWNILDREIFIAIWIVIAILMGVYFLGKIRLPHDSETPVTSVPRLILAIVTFTFAVYLIPGMFGAPLRALSGVLPPMSTHDFDLPSIVRQYTREGKVLCDEPKYGNSLKMPHGLKGYFDFEQALNCAKEKNKPLFIDFTGHGCANCQRMEENVWSDPEVLRVLVGDYVLVSLYVDDKTALPEDEVYISSFDGKTKRTVGARNFDIQKSRFHNAAQPFYVLMDPHTQELLAQPIGYEASVMNYLDFLKEGVENFK